MTPKSKTAPPGILDRLRSLFSGAGDEPTPAEDLRAALDEARAELADLEAKLEEAEAGLGAVLLSAPASQAQAAEEGVEQLRRAVTRLRAVVRELPGRIEAAEAAASQAAAEERLQELVAKVARGGEIVEAYGRLSAELVPLIEELHAIDQEVQSARRAEDLESVRSRIPLPPSMAHRGGSPWSLPEAVSLPPVAEGAPGWRGRSAESAWKSQAQVDREMARYSTPTAPATQDPPRVLLKDEKTGEFRPLGSREFAR